MQTGTETLRTTTRAAVSDGKGLAGWLIRLYRSRNWSGTRVPAQMELVETLPLGTKRQLMLVVCDGQRYLVGVGAESVDAIVPLCGTAPAPNASTGGYL